MEAAKRSVRSYDNDFNYNHYNNRNYKDIIEKIFKIQQLGHQIRFAGGTSTDGTKNALVAPPKILFFKRLEVLVVGYERNVRISNNLMNEIFDEEVNEWDDLCRNKLLYETGLSSNSFIQVPHAQSFCVDNRYNDPSRLHEKRLYITGSFTGELLKLENSSLLGRETLEPFWIPAFLLAECLFVGHLKFFKDMVFYLRRERLISHSECYMVTSLINRRLILLDMEKKIQGTKL